MDKTKLFPHNREAYDNVTAHFAQGNRLACIVHATGTGKSYVIGAVADDFDRVLVVAPNDYVISQVQQTVKPSVQFMNYSKLYTDFKADVFYPDKFDLIVFDEYHRTGADEWGKAVIKIIEDNPQAKVFGTTATDIRYLDNERNMSDELFEGNIVSTLTIGQAWARDILKAPVYVCGLISFDETRSEQEKRIRESEMDDDKKRQSLSLLDRAQLEWEKVGGVVGLVKKYITPDIKRILVFCPDIASSAQWMDQIKQWFLTAGIPIHSTYTVDSSKPDSLNFKNMEEFQQDGFEGVKVMFSVNMLNEGIHVPRVNAVIMLRRTISGNVFLQQFGRCMTSNKEELQPVVLDLQNNIVNASPGKQFEQMIKDYNKEKEKLERVPGARIGHNIRIVDYLKEQRTLYRQIDEYYSYASQWAIWDKNYAEAKEHFEKTGHFPTKSENKRIRGWAHKWVRLSSYKYPERLQLLLNIGYETPISSDYNWDKNYAEAKEHFEKTGHFPTRKEYKRIYMWANQWVKDSSNKYPERLKMLQQIGYEIPDPWAAWDKIYEEAKAHFEKTGHFPTNKENKRIREWANKWVRRLSNKFPERIKMLQNIGYEIPDPWKEWDKNYAEAKEHFEETGHFPTTSENKRIYKWANNWVRERSDKYPERLEMLQNIGYEMPDPWKEWDKNYAEAKEHFKQTGHFPTKSENKRIRGWANNWVKKSSSKDPERLQMLYDIGYPKKE